MPKLMLLLIATLPMMVMAQQDPYYEANKPVTCGPFQNIARALMGDKFREMPLWIGSSGDDASKFALFYNDSTRTWTLVQYGSDTGCILGAGNTSDIVNLAPFRAQH